MALLLRISDQARRPVADDRHAGAGAEPADAPGPRWWRCREHAHPPALDRGRAALRRAARLDDAASSSSRRSRSTPGRTTGARCCDNYSRERGPILVGGKPVAKSVPTERRAQVPAHLPAGRALRPRHRLLLVHVRRRRRPRGRRERPASGSSDSSSTAGSPTCSPASSRPARRVELTINPEARRPRPTRRSATSAAPSSPSTPRPARSWRWSATRQYDPEPRWPATTRAKVAKAWKTLNADPTQPLVNRAIAGNLYPPGSMFKLVTAAAALRERQVHRGDARSPARPCWTCRRRPPNLPNDDRQPAGRATRPRSPTRSRSPATRPSAASACSSGAEALARPGREVRLRRPPRRSRCASRRAASRPTSTSRRPPSPPSGSTTCGSRRCRWPWSRPAIANHGVRDAALPGRAGAHLRPRGHRRATARAAVAGASPPRPRRTLTRMMESVVEQRHRHARRRSTASRSPARPAPRSTATGKPPHAWFTGVRPGGRPQGRRRRRRRGRRQRGQRGRRRPGRRADRQGRHGGGARPMTSSDPAGGSAAATRLDRAHRLGRDGRGLAGPRRGARARRRRQGDAPEQRRGRRASLERFRAEARHAAG